MHKALSLNPVDALVNIEEICSAKLKNSGIKLGFTRNNIAFDVMDSKKSAKFIRWLSVKNDIGMRAKNTVDARTLLILSKAKSRFA